MPKLPRTKEELLADEAAHPNRGTLGGEPIIEEGTIHFRATIPVELYNQVLQTAIACGIGSKTNIAVVAISELLAGHYPSSTLPEFERSPEASRDFRAMIPLSLYELFAETAKAHDLSITDLGYMALYVFANRNSRQTRYAKFLQKQSTKYGVSEQDVVAAIEGYWRKLGRRKRLNLVSEGNPEAAERKMT